MYRGLQTPRVNYCKRCTALGQGTSNTEVYMWLCRQSDGGAHDDDARKFPSRRPDQKVAREYPL